MVRLEVFGVLLLVSFGYGFLFDSDSIWSNDAATLLRKSRASGEHKEMCCMTHMTFGESGKKCFNFHNRTRHQNQESSAVEGERKRKDPRKAVNAMICANDCLAKELNLYTADNKIDSQKALQMYKEAETDSYRLEIVENNFARCLAEGESLQSEISGKAKCNAVLFGTHVCLSSAIIESCPAERKPQDKPEACDKFKAMFNKDNIIKAVNSQEEN